MRPDGVGAFVDQNREEGSPNGLFERSKNKARSVLSLSNREPLPPAGVRRQ